MSVKLHSGNGDRRNGGRNGHRNGLRRRLYRWHRWLGLVAGILVLVLAATGPLLTHADALGLQKNWVKSELLLALYDDAAPAAPPRGVKTPAGWIVGVDGMVFAGDRLIARDAGPLLGASATDRYIAVAAREAVLLMTPDGRLVERLDGGALPGRIERAGERNDSLIVKTAGGTYRAGADFLSWSAARPETVTWLDVDQSLDPAVAERAVANYSRHTISLHRLVADIHSGRIVGTWGPYVMDGAAVVLLILIITGFINWRGTARRRR